MFCEGRFDGDVLSKIMTGKETVDIMTERVESCCGNFFYKNDVFTKGENLYSTSGHRF